MPDSFWTGLFTFAGLVYLGWMQQRAKNAAAAAAGKAAAGAEQVKLTLQATTAQQVNTMQSVVDVATQAADNAAHAASSAGQAVRLVAETNKVADAKRDETLKTLGTVQGLLNGEKHLLLQAVAELTAEKAARSGKAEDRLAADKAQQALAQHDARLAAGQ